MQRAAVLVDILTVGSTMKKCRAHFESSKKFWSLRRRRAIGAIDGHAEPAQIGGNTAREPLHIGMPQSRVSGDARNRWRGIGRHRYGVRLQERKDFLFNPQFVRVRQLVATA